MDMHQAGDKPDWAMIPPNKRNFWQQFAADTQGFGTPGNALSVIGFMCVLCGLWIVVTRSLWEGTILISIGRIADLVDGMIAHRTGTKSPFGRLLDASLDKAGALLSLFIFAAVGVLPIWIAAFIAAQNITNIALSTYAPWRHTLLKPSLAGKLSTAAFWLTIVGFVGATLLHESTPAFIYVPAYFIAYIVTALALMLGVIASLGYLNVIRMAPRHIPKKQRSQ